MFAKRSTQAATLHHKKPASSVDAEIIGGSTLSSQAMLKQEVSTASSKGSTLKKGMLLCPKISAPICKFTSYYLVGSLSCSILDANWHFEGFDAIMLA